MTPKSTRYRLDESIGHLTSQASRAILKRINQELARSGHALTSEQFSVLVYLWDQDGQPQYVLAEQLNKDKTNMARLVAGLEALGLVKRLPGERDAREKIVHLSEAGHEIMGEVTELVQGLLDIAQRGIDAKELAVCKNVLRRFTRNLLEG